MPLNLFKKLLQRDPKNYVALNNRATLTRKMGGSPHLAIQDYRQAVNLNPSYEIGQYNLLVNYKDCEIFDTVVILGNHYLQKFENERDVLFILGESHNRLGNYNKALSIFNEILSSNTHYSRALKEKSFALNQLGMSEDAMEFGLLAVEQEPKYAAGWNNLGILYQKQNNFDLAYKCFTDAIKIDSSSSTYFWNRGILMFEKLGESENGCYDLKKSAKLGSKKAEAYRKKHCPKTKSI